MNTKPFSVQAYNEDVAMLGDYHVETKSGKLATLFTVTGGGAFPVVGKIAGSDNVIVWGPDGLYSGASTEDTNLILVENPPKSLGFINVNAGAPLFKTRNEADLAAADDRISCVEVFALPTHTNVPA
ncbi:hypothetical protein CLV58_10621 [Spirosoma oryzae]|uniref:Bacteriophage lambda head decoration protein D n=1 Tax=Spirosoma oryzae TaxID=1469603 RepID=A0A2T0T581_9BACT|nr:hypothetical protein [Spirosoma oryzae]PRY40838.1 hypothetical protein CLV58_10621 [Spirosoma oryzae]